MPLAGLREVVDADSWALIALISACWAEYPGCVVDIEGEYPELRAPASHYRAAGGILWVVPEGDWMAASVGLMPARPGTAELVKLYVARHRRGQGLGQALVKWVEHQARTRGDRQIELWSDTRFHAAHQLYQRCGFSTTGESRDLHDLSGTTEYAFHKSLSGPPG